MSVRRMAACVRRVSWRRRANPVADLTPVPLVTSRDPFLGAAIEEAELGLLEGGIPIGSVLVHAGR
ncbi:MAG: hypothetical protein LPK85_11275, partial [Gammaproteobacteria bacterium]|nr:hypothetical protein [Gammaproteobacteria bacterium]